MSDTGRIELACRTDSIIVGLRQRHDLGDLGPLMESMQALGLLQPVTVTPDRVLVCGRRRLEAAKRLGWTTLKVWVRTGVSEGLEALLAQQDENALRKPLSALEQAALYREIKKLQAEDAARRQQETWINTKTANSIEIRGCPDSGQPAQPHRRASREAALMVTGAASHNRLEQICEMERLVVDPDVSPEVRQVAEDELSLIRNGGAVDPGYQRVKAAQRFAATMAPPEAPANPHVPSSAALAESNKERKRQARENRERRIAEASRARRSVRAFRFMWAELDGWTQRYDLDQLARELTAEDEELFRRVVDQTVAFAEALTLARSTAST